MMRWLVVTAVLVATVAVGVSSASAGRTRTVRPSATAAPCANPPDNNPRNPANPLDLPVAPGFDPLHTAHFFVDGPAHGAVAKAIEQLIGDATQYQDTDTWSGFRASLLSGPLSQLIASDPPTSPTLATQVKLLIKLGDEEETNNLSEYSMGGGPGAIYAQTLKINCTNMLSDPAGSSPAGETPAGGIPSGEGPTGDTDVTPSPNPTIPVFSTFFVYPNGQFCPTYKELYDWGVVPSSYTYGPEVNGIPPNLPIFQRMISEMALAQGDMRGVYLLEIDSVGASECMKGATLKLWEALLRYEIVAMTALPHTVVYQEAGSSDEGTPTYVANLLFDICVVRVNGEWVNECARLRGFYTNATHFNWDRNEITWFSKVAKLLDKLVFRRTGTHYHAFHVINTAQNGQGPLLNPHPVKQGIENLCNPPGRGLGRIPTADTMPTFDGQTLDGSWPDKIVDAFLWSGTPGRSHNANCPGGPWAAAGVFDPRFAQELASAANQQLARNDPASEPFGYPLQPF